MQFESKYNIGDIVTVYNDEEKMFLAVIIGIIAAKDGIFYRGKMLGTKPVSDYTFYLYNTYDEETDCGEYHFQNGASAINGIGRKVGEMTDDEMENNGILE